MSNVFTWSILLAKYNTINFLKNRAAGSLSKKLILWLRTGGPERLFQPRWIVRGAKTMKVPLIKETSRWVVTR